MTLTCTTAIQPAAAAGRRFAPPLTGSIVGWTLSTDSRISVTRPREWFARFRKLKVLVDGELVARIGAGKTVEFAVEPGLRRLQVKMDWCTSEELEFLAKAGEIHRFRSTSPSVWRARKMMWALPEFFFELLPVD